MCIVFGLFSCLLFIYEACAIENYYNGWRPISNEKVFNNLRLNFLNLPVTQPVSTAWKPLGVEIEDNLFEDDILGPHDINTQLANDKELNVVSEQNQEEIFDQSHGSSTEMFDTQLVTNEKPGLNLRRAKKILETSDSDNTITDNSENVNKVIENKQQGNIKKTNNLKSNDYEVTEATEIKDLLDTNQSVIDDTRSYFKPNLKPESLTSKLFSILGDYNIRSNDGLTNYAASRNRYKSNSVPVIPVRSWTRYNSHNHFPIDPMLAVFLSNYGHYLPGFYGFPGYYNLYGYLASNNIHNNKPFGAYKIYSDTDSSH